MIELKFAELHTPLFLAGTNLNVKLMPDKRQGLKIAYDRDHKELHVTYNGETGIIPSSNIVSMVVGKVVEPPKPVAPTTPIKAQASTPQDHVFAGHGHGKTK